MLTIVIICIALVCFANGFFLGIKLKGLSYDLLLKEYKLLQTNYNAKFGSFKILIQGQRRTSLN